MGTVFVAMSGGLDSSCAAYILKKKGHKVVGITFSLFSSTFFEKHSIYLCNSRATVEEAKKVAGDLAIPHYVIDLSDVFYGRVVDAFIGGYRSGITPNPCILCNRYVKFGAFVEKAFEMGADMVATGHYARIHVRDGDILLKKGVDLKKDQSYFLYNIDKEVLGKIIFPLGEHTKESLRKMAVTDGLCLPPSRESQDICFIPNKDCGSFLSSFIKPVEGNIYHVNGTLLGRHKGIHLYTVGQRRGINIPYREALYVLDIRPDENIIVVGTKKELGRRFITAGDINMLQPVSEGMKARVRYRQKERACSCAVSGNTLSVGFHEDVDCITPGQSVVLYRDDTVAGGGIIKETY